MNDNKFDISSFVNINTVDSIKTKLVNNFIKRRKEYGLSQKELAIKSGVSYASIRRFESTGEISFSSLLRLIECIDRLDDMSEILNKPIIKDINI